MGSFSTEFSRGLPIDPFRLAQRAEIPPAHLATRVFGNLRERINL